jgi:hypothetical protein
MTSKTLAVLFLTQHFQVLRQQGDCSLRSEKPGECRDPELLGVVLPAHGLWPAYLEYDIMGDIVSFDFTIRNDANEVTVTKSVSGRVNLTIKTTPCVGCG